MRNIFINLPVKNLNETIGFFTQLGFKFNPQFTDHNAACMIVDENIYVMLLVDTFFKTFTTKEIIDTRTHIQTLLALSVKSKEDVDSLTEKAILAGAIISSETKDYGFMYQKTFDDINGHTWEIFWMDPNHVEEVK